VLEVADDLAPLEKKSGASAPEGELVVRSEGH